MYNFLEIPEGYIFKKHFKTKTHTFWFYTIEELKWYILILQWRGIGNDLK